MKLSKRVKHIVRRIKKVFLLFDTLRYDLQRAEMERSLYESELPGTTSAPVAEREVVVSLTTFGRRIEQVHVTIESLLRQTIKPNRVILWLAEDEAAKPLPAALLKQMKRGLEVRYTPDLRSYKKLIPALQAFPEALIITVDDDIIYDSGLVDRLLRGHQRFTNCIVANSTYRLPEAGKNYTAGHLDNEYDNPRLDLLAFTGNGALFPPGAFTADVFNTEAIERLCPNADDIWFKAMSMLTGTMVVRVATAFKGGWDLVTNLDVQDCALWRINVNGGQNNIQYGAVMNAYGLSV